jgi:hypothetical protein
VKYHNGEAAETLKNRTICVKEGNRIRKLRDIDDIEQELLVFVDNVVLHGEYVDHDIKPFTSVRYAILNVSFR